MPIDKHKIKVGTSLDDLQPHFRVKVEKWLNDCQAENLFLFIDFTLRTRAEQAALYAKGRKRVGPIWVKVGTTVTNAPPGSSYHEYGLALDVYPLHMGAPTFATPVSVRVVDLAKRNGLSWGGDWKSIKDRPHFQDASAPTIRACKRLWPHGWQP